MELLTILLMIRLRVMITCDGVGGF